MNFIETNDKNWVVMWRIHGEVMLHGVYRTKRDAYCALLQIYKHEKEVQEWDKETSDKYFSDLIRTYKNSKVLFGNLDIAFAEEAPIFTTQD